MSLDVTGILNALVSHAQTIGHLEQLNQHEPKSAPQGLLTGAIWNQRTRPIAAASGLASTTANVIFMVRIYRNMLSEPQDAIDPEVMTAMDALMAAYISDFTLDGLIKQIDVFGVHGQALEAVAGYMPQDGRLYRVLDIFVPCVVNDLWSQSP